MNKNNNQKGGKKKIKKKKWTTFLHNGVIFNEPYEKHNIPINYKNKTIILSDKAEEYATIYAKCIGSDYINNNKFNTNFWKSWKNFLKDTEIKSLSDCDFTSIYNYLQKKKEEKTLINDNEKKKIKERRQIIIDYFSKVVIDEKEEKISNPIVEPPGIFIGRGNHPLIGKIKERIEPEDVTINIGKGNKIPPIVYIKNDKLVEMKNRKWGNIINDNKVEWVASWHDSVLGKKKYIWLSDTSDFKSTSDMKKFDLARRLKKKISAIRTSIIELLNSNDDKSSQLAIAIYLIDNLALRIGNEKGSEEADTVGVCSLRVEHLILNENNSVTLDFLGKDTVRYVNTIKVDDIIYKNLKKNLVSKNKNDQIFNLITPSNVNEYLQSFLKGLTAKTFRTYNASNLFQIKIRRIIKKYEDFKKENVILSENEIKSLYERALIDVAKLCNHQKNIGKTSNNVLKNIKDRIQKLNNQKKKKSKSKSKSKTTKKSIEKLNEKIKNLKEKYKLKNELKNISLETSKINYIDPRITASFSKKLNLNINMFWNSKLTKKFSWALSSNDNFIF